MEGVGHRGLVPTVDLRIVALPHAGMAVMEWKQYKLAQLRQHGTPGHIAQEDGGRSVRPDIERRALIDLGLKSRLAWLSGGFVLGDDMARSPRLCNPA
jgi:hypothetical protein